MQLVQSMIPDMNTWKVYVPYNAITVQECIDNAQKVAEQESNSFKAEYLIVTNLTIAAAFSFFNAGLYVGLGMVKFFEALPLMEARLGYNHFKENLSDAGASLKLALLGPVFIFGAVFAPKKVAHFVAENLEKNQALFAFESRKETIASDLQDRFNKEITPFIQSLYSDTSTGQIEQEEESF